MRHTFLFVILLSLGACGKKEMYRFKVQEDGFFSQPYPVAFTTTALDVSGLSGNQNLGLFKKNRDSTIQIPYQWDKSGKETLWFVHNPSQNGHYFFAELAPETVSSSMLEPQKSNGNLQLKLGDNPVVTYRYKKKYPPEGVDSSYVKSGYIHPLISPKGDTLTRIQPPDHYHHYGIWGPWTKTKIEGRAVDFWNLKLKEGTVLFKEFSTMGSGGVYSFFEAQQEHIDFGSEPPNQVALNENLNVRLWKLSQPDRYMLDYTTNFSTPLKSGILFEAYRYGGGLGMRFNGKWNKNNCEVFTSEGNDRATADGTRARWCIVKGPSDVASGTSGILFLSHPTNREHPEPMRIWPLDANDGRGDMFFEFCPIRHEPWEIAPNNTYQLKYRMIVFNGELTEKEAESYWQSFASPPKIELHY